MIPKDKIKIGMFVRVISKSAGVSTYSKDEIKDTMYSKGAYVVNIADEYPNGFVAMLNPDKKQKSGNFFLPKDLEFFSNNIDDLLEVENDTNR